MKLKENLALRYVAGMWVVLPLANKVLDFDGMITLNETGHLLWELLERGSTQEDMAAALTNESNEISAILQTNSCAFSTANAGISRKRSSRVAKISA